MSITSKWFVYLVSRKLRCIETFKGQIGYCTVGGGTQRRVDFLNVVWQVAHDIGLPGQVVVVIKGRTSYYGDPETSYLPEINCNKGSHYRETTLVSLSMYVPDNCTLQSKCVNGNLECHNCKQSYSKVILSDK